MREQIIIIIIIFLDISNGMFDESNNKSETKANRKSKQTLLKADEGRQRGGLVGFLFRFWVPSVATAG